MIAAESVNAALLHEPWEVETKTAGFYKVYTPVLEGRARAGDPGAPAGAGGSGSACRLARLGPSFGLGSRPGHEPGRVRRAGVRGSGGGGGWGGRLQAFLESALHDYDSGRDRTDHAGTSLLSDHLATGEISPRTIWHAAHEVFARAAGGAATSAETYLKEIVWREFAYHLLYHTPQIETGNGAPSGTASPGGRTMRMRSAGARAARASRWSMPRCASFTSPGACTTAAGC